MRVKTKGREMKDATVEYISLVPRGANQIPFRIIKSHKNQENTGMGIDITSFPALLRRQKAEKQIAPSISAFVVKKGEALDAQKEAIKAAGFDVEKAVEKSEEGLVIFMQGDTTEETLTDATMVGFGAGDVQVAIKGFTSWGSGVSTFTDKVQAQGFYSGLDMALDVLECSLFNEASDDDDRAKTFTDVGEVIDQFKAYVMGLLGQVPEKAFKAELALKSISLPAQGKRSINGDPGGSALRVDTDVDPTDTADSIHGQKQPNTEVLPKKIVKKNVFDLEKLMAALKDETITREQLIEAVEVSKAQLTTAIVVQDEDGPGEGSPTKGANSDKPLHFVSAVNKNDNGMPDNGDEEDIDKKDGKKDGKAKKDEPAPAAGAQKSEQLPTEQVDAGKGAGNNGSEVALKGELEKILGAVQGMSESVKKMDDRLGKLEAQQQEQGAAVQLAVTKSEEVQQALKGTVIGGAPANVEQAAIAPARARKHDQGGVLDTAFGGRAVFGDR